MIDKIEIYYNDIYYNGKMSIEKGEMMEEYNILSSQEKSIGRFKIVCDEILGKDGNIYPYSYVKIKNCAATLCMLKDEILLVKQYRHTLKSWEYEIPAGSIEKNEEPIKAAKREVEEELGYKVEMIKYLGWFHLSVGSTTEKVYLYYAECSENIGQSLDALEKINIYKVKIGEFEELIENGIFHQCMGVTAWERYKSLKKLDLYC